MNPSSSPARKAGILLVGLGPNGRGRLRDLPQSPWVEIKAVCDAREDLVREVTSATWLPGFTDLEEALKTPGIDAVHCATSTPGHAPVTIASLRAGKHVFCEKPMAIRPEDARAMLAAERESGKRLQINFETRWSYAPRRIHEIFASGEIGDLNSAMDVHFRGGWSAGSGYRLDPTLSGGAIMECPIHTIDHLRWLGGDFRSVQVFRSPTVRPAYPPDLADNFTAVLEWESGLTATLLITHGASATDLPVPGNYNHADAWTSRGHHKTLTIIGTKGSLVYDSWRTRLLVFRYNDAAGTVDFVREENYRHFPQGKLDHDSAGYAGEFYRRMLHGEEPVQTAADAWKSTATALAAEASIREGGRRVEIRGER